MDIENLEIRGRKFRTKSDYAAGFRDNRIIEGLERKLDKTSLESVRELIAELDSGKYKFETLIGEDFMDELVELESELKRRPVQTDTKSGRGRGKTSGAGGSATMQRGRLSKENETVDSPKSLDDYDADMKMQIIKEMKKVRRRRTLTLVVLALCILGSVGYLVFYYTMYEKNDAEYNELATLVKADEGGTVEVTINYDEAKDKPPVLKKYETLYQKNKKIIGWLKIDGCNIDYPVMQTTNNDYYLDHNYNQDYDKNGSLFLDKDCDAAFPNDNMIIYGHHMKSGKMFGNLNYYAKEDFYKKNPEFTFDTIYETGTYAVMYVFRSKIYSEEEIVFKYYQFIDATSADEFYSNMDAMAEMSLYDTGVTASYGDRLITLSTCDSSEADGRFVVVAKKIK